MSKDPCESHGIEHKASRHDHLLLTSSVLDEQGGKQTGSDRMLPDAPISREKKAYTSTSPPFFSKGHAMGKKMVGTNEFAFFRCKSICTGGGV